MPERRREDGPLYYYDYFTSSSRRTKLAVLRESDIRPCWLERQKQIAGCAEAG